MRKSAAVLPVLALVAGAAGFLLRRMELGASFQTKTGEMIGRAELGQAFETGTAFAVRNAPLTTALIVLSAAAIVLAAAVGIVISSRMEAVAEYSGAFAPKSTLYLAVSFVLGLGWLAADVLYFIDTYGKGAGVLELIFVFLAAVSAFSLIILARGAYKGRGGPELLVFSVAPSIFFCFWLILVYKNNAANPVIVSFCFQCLAIAAAALATYFTAGFVYRKAATGRTIASLLAAVLFCAMVLADPVGLPVKLMFGFAAAGSFLNACVFLRNLKPKEA